MTYDMIIVLVALLLAIILFATELLRVDVVAVMIMATLMLTGVLTPAEGLAGFSNTATATVAAMFVLSAAMENSGVMIPLTKRMEAAFQKSFWFGFLLMIFIAGFFSAFVNNTPVVAILIPVVIAAAMKSGISPSKVLIPLSFVSMFGGVCTLVGTSTNILVSEISQQYGYGAFGMFEMTSMGLIFFGVGTFYVIFIGLRLLPDYGKTTDLDEVFHISKYLTNIIVTKEALTAKKRLGEVLMLNEDDEVVQITRGQDLYYLPDKYFVLAEGDVVKIKSTVEKIKKLKDDKRVEIKPLLTDEILQHGQKNLRYVEAIVSPGSSLVDEEFKDIDFRGRYNAALLAIRARASLFIKLMMHERIVSGDSMLLAIEQDDLNELRKNQQDFILVTEPVFPNFDLKKGILAVGIVVMVILLASLKILPILTAAIAGCILMLLSGCIDAERAYRAVDWKVIFLLAGAMSFGIAMEKTGLADLLASLMINVTDGYGPIVLLSAVYLVTSLLTETMSNNATVVLLAPIVISMAETLGVSPTPFLMAITFAASSSFVTPIGYQTNTMVHAAGNYKFKDFFKVGIWLNLLFWMLATVLIPMFFPF